MTTNVPHSPRTRTPGAFSNSQPESRSPRLPPEIIDMIIHHLHKHKPTLVACSEVSRSFVPLSRHYLFQELIVRKVAVLVSLLDSPLSTINPHISLVTLRGEAQQFDSHSIRRILSLPAVERLSIHNLNWSALPARTRSVLSDDLPRLTVLRLRNISFHNSGEIVDILRACPGLRGLEMYDYDIYFSPTEPIDPLTINMHVRKLHFGSSIEQGRVVEARMLDWLLALPNVWPLDSLKIGPLGSLELPKAWHFVQTLKPFLRDFVVFFGPNLEKLFSKTFRLNDFTQLESFEFPIATTRPVDFNEFLIPLVSMLPHSIRHITLRLMLTKTAELENIDWPALIALFSGNTQFPYLSCVQLWVHGCLPGSIISKKNSVLVRQRLAKHNATRLFVVAPIAAWRHP